MMVVTHLWWDGSEMATVFVPYSNHLVENLKKCFKKTYIGKGSRHDGSRARFPVAQSCPSHVACVEWFCSRISPTPGVVVGNGGIGGSGEVVGGARCRRSLIKVKTY